MIIRTPDQRLRVFVSSTLGELADERRAVARSISALRLTPVMFELGARPHPPQDLYRAYLAQSDFRTAAELGRLVRDDLATLLSERFAAGSALAAEPAVAPSRPAAQHPPRPLCGAPCGWAVVIMAGRAGRG